MEAVGHIAGGYQMPLHAQVMNNRKFQFRAYWRQKNYFLSPLALLFVFILNFSCNRKPDGSGNFVFSFKNLDEYPLEMVNVVELVDVVNPIHICFKYEKLIIGESKGDTLIHIYDPNSGKVISKKGINGYGPNEIPSVWNFDRGFSDSTFWAYSLEGKSFYEFHLLNSDPYPINQIKQSEIFFLAMGMTWTMDTTLITFLADGPDKLVEFSSDGEILNKYGLWKNMIPGDFEDFIVADVHQGQIKGVPSKEKYVKISVFRDRIEILDKKTGKITLSDGPYNEIPKFEVISGRPSISSQSYLAFTSFDVSENMITTLFSGEKLEKVDRVREGENIIILYKLSGQPICILKSPFPLINITLDEVGRRIFGLVEAETTKLVELKIPEKVFEMININ